ncbi:MAG: hypothetical protein K1X72_20155 [Pyrinomonadaceae bacterium]|nr:hypothetical protein [Pyrinomonadaceae bacterium]
MKMILILTLSLLTLSFASFAQENKDCPNVSVQGPTGQTPIGGNMEFSVSSMEKLANRGFEFKWTVSNGVSFNGQGTPTISISTNEKMEGQMITATVEIKGLPEGCKNTDFASGDVAQPPPYCPQPNKDIIGGNSSWQEVISRIQNLNIILEGEKGYKGIITFNVTNSSELNKVMEMQKKVLEISKKNKIPLDGITMKTVKGDVYEIIFELIPSPRN